MTRELRYNPEDLRGSLVPHPQLGVSTARENKVRVTEGREGLVVISQATRIGGQRVVLSIFRSDDQDAPDYWRVALLVGGTRQAKKEMRAQAGWPSGYDGKSTGLSGVKALMWAKSQLDTFQKTRPEANLVVGSSDDRRLSMYKRALTRYGFAPGIYDEESVVFRTNEMYRNALRKTQQLQESRAQLNPEDLRGRHIPDRYLAGLPPALKAKRIAELTASRDAYGTGDFSELPTDQDARRLGLVKKSQYRVLAEQRGFDVQQVGSYEEMLQAAAHFYLGRALRPRELERGVAALTKVYAKGLAAWKSGGHRPGATAKNWADARLASFLVGGKGPRTADRKEFAMLPKDMQTAIFAMAAPLSSR
jgi:hypothetical protein